MSGEGRIIPAVRSRREFLHMACAGGIGGWLVGCATNPVTGRKQFMLMSEDSEISLDRQHAPHQISEDFGGFPDPAVNAYLSDVGARMAAVTHRPHMPYSFQCVNASYINAYAFPGGTIACTRGILSGMENEAQLAALIGHELGHVNYRHTGSRQSKGMGLQVLVALGAIAAGMKDEDLVPVVELMGGLGAGLLLARYSRQDERQADAVGMEYMVKAGHNPAGMEQLMQLLVRSHERQPNALELMFATHPMSSERLDTARRSVRGIYAAHAGIPVNRELYMDGIAPVRAQAPVIRNIQRADLAMSQRHWTEAEGAYRTALAASRESDYEALIKISHCLRIQKRTDESLRYAQLAKQVMPGEAQAHAASGLAALEGGKSAAALAEFKAYERVLPGNPGMTFYSGRALEGLGRKKEAAEAFSRYLQVGGTGESATYATQRLTDWGMMTQP